jgi:branched-chain amino acid transport system substrate-binding protein
MILSGAMKKAGVEKDALRTAIESTTGLVGVSGVFNITAQDHNGLGLDSLVMVKIEKGKWVLQK